MPAKPKFEIEEWLEVIDPVGQWKMGDRMKIIGGKPNEAGWMYRGEREDGRYIGYILDKRVIQYFPPPPPELIKVDLEIPKFGKWRTDE